MWHNLVTHQTERALDRYISSTFVYLPPPIISQLNHYVCSDTDSMPLYACPGQGGSPPGFFGVSITILPFKMSLLFHRNSKQAQDKLRAFWAAADEMTKADIQSDASEQMDEHEDGNTEGKVSKGWAEVYRRILVSVIKV